MVAECSNDLDTKFIATVGNSGDICGPYVWNVEAISVCLLGIN